MGKVFEKIKIQNLEDIFLSEKGYILKDKIREIEVEGLVDTGATLLQLPKDIVDKLGLKIYREVTATYADGRKQKKSVARGLLIEILGRQAEVECIVEPEGSQVLIGQIPLEAMDLVVDCRTNKLGPRPESPDMAMIDMF
ncbi:MAG: retroviral-like aspartic protease family protein [Candidatus Hydrogenedentota bacterium]